MSGKGKSSDLTTEQLLDFIEQRLNADEIVQVEKHLADCSSCQLELNWLQQALGLMRSDDWLETPQELTLAVKGIYREHQHKFAKRTRSKDRRRSRWLDRLEGLFAPRPRLAFAMAMAITLIVISTIVYQVWINPVESHYAIAEAINGRVEIQEQGSQVWQAVTPNTGPELSGGSNIRTREESGLELRFPDDSQTLLEPNTEVKILQLNARSNGSRQVTILQQDFGLTVNRIQTLPTSDSRFEIRTPAATISVRGTEFTVYVDEEGVTTVVVSEGIVHVAGQGTTVVLTDGQGTVVEPGTRPIPPDPLPTPTLRATMTSNDGSPTGTTSDNDSSSDTSEGETSPPPNATDESNPQPTSTPESSGVPTSTPTQPFIPTQVPGPTDTPQPTATDDGNVPPGLTRTPNPPGQTKTPQPSSGGSNPSNG